MKTWAQETAVTILNLILRMEKKISILKDARFSGEGRQSLHIIIYVMRIRKMLISYVTLDHTLYSINYGIYLLCGNVCDY